LAARTDELNDSDFVQLEVIYPSTHGAGSRSWRGEAHEAKATVSAKSKEVSHLSRTEFERLSDIGKIWAMGVYKRGGMVD